MSLVLLMNAVKIEKIRDKELEDLTTGFLKDFETAQLNDLL